jgi:hypothetical protein
LDDDVAVEAPPPPRESWGPGRAVAVVGVFAFAAGGAVDSAAGTANLVLGLAGEPDPRLDTVQDAGAVTLAVGVGAIGAGGAMAAGQLHRDGLRAPTWAGWTAAGLEVVAVGAMLAPLPGPEWAWEQAKWVGLPFALVQVVQVGAASHADGENRRPLLQFAVAPTVGGVGLTGRF